MAVESRMTVIFVKGDAFSPSVTCNFLYGEENIDRNGDKMIYVNNVVPMQENELKQMPYNCTLNKESIRKCQNSKLNILGLVCDNVVNREIFEILKREVNLRSFCVLVISVHEIVSGKSLVLVLNHSRETPHCNIKNVPRIEVRIVCLAHGLCISKLNWLYPMDLDETIRKGEKLLKPNFNGIIRGHQVQLTDETVTTHSPKIFNHSSGFKLLFISLSWFLELVLPSLKFPVILRKVATLLPKYLFVAKQLSYRFDQISKMFVDKQEHKEEENVSPKSVDDGNLIMSLLFDIILGFLFIYFVFSNQHCLNISSWLIGQKYNIAEQLSSLLKWLMGAPAGLKLNIPLNQFLGNFYIYHVHLWTSYLFFVEAYLPKIILCCTLAGCLGVTFLLALLCDILFFLTVHIYCFYIYAARLFSVEIHVLASLLRLFTGKKWNFLRGRVDSVEYDVDRLFIGTLLFTILLFLFPTVFLYYIVFTALRLLVLLVQSMLCGVVALLNSFPFYGLWLYILYPQNLPGEVIVNTKTITCSSGIELDYFTTKNVNLIQPDSCLYLSFRHKCLPCGILFKNCKNVIFETTYRNIFGEGIFKKLLTGQLISKP